MHSTSGQLLAVLAIAMGVNVTCFVLSEEHHPVENIQTPYAAFTLPPSVDGWGLSDISMCFPGLYHKGDFIGQCICVYLHCNAI